MLESCKPGGGLIFGSSNSILSGLPTANFLALQAAAREFGVYEGLTRAAASRHSSRVMA